MPRKIIKITFFLSFGRRTLNLFFFFFFGFHPSGREVSLSLRARSCISGKLGTPLRDETNGTRSRKSSR